MSEHPKHHVLITNLTANDDAFAVIPDSGEGVYIPPGVTRAAKLLAGEFRTVTVIPNNPDRQSNTKWMGIYVDPPATSMPDAHRDESVALQERLLFALDDPEVGYLTTSEAARELGIEVTAARELLDRMFNERKVARADVHYGSNKRATAVLWARNPEEFL